MDPLSNLSAGTELQATAESAEASARYHTQDGRHPGETIFCALLPGVVCVPCVMVTMAGNILRFSDVEGLAETYFGAWKLEAVALMKTVFLSVFCLAPRD